MSVIKFRYPVYNPCIDTVDVAADWGDFDTTQCYQTALSQPFSVAAVRVFYDEPWVFNFDPVIAQLDVTAFDLVLLSDIEYYSQKQILDWVKSKGIKNYVLAVGGLNNELLDSNVVYRPYWAKSYLEKNSFGQLDTSDRPYMFDCMLGARRPHRDYVMLALTRTGVLDKSIVTYRDCFPGGFVNSDSEHMAAQFPGTKLNWPYVSPNLDPSWEVADKINNQVNLVSPVNIFQKTNYSIVTETIGTGNSFFLSEKTTKCMSNYRPFVVFGPRHYLKNLRELGFQTFDTVIDESYDNEPVDSVRFQKAMMQVLQLTYFESVESVYNRVRFALVTNAEHLDRLLFQSRYAQQQLLFQYIGGQHFDYPSVN